MAAVAAGLAIAGILGWAANEIHKGLQPVPVVDADGNVISQYTDQRPGRSHWVGPPRHRCAGRLLLVPVGAGCSGSPFHRRAALRHRSDIR
jgi:hypothetical protein